MFGPCAKKQVRCLLIGASGKMYAGENLCLYPQPSCPREPGEGYEKCKTICGQLHHAEEQALNQAGEDAAGGTLHVAYHYCCADCTGQAALAGVSNIVCEEAMYHMGGPLGEGLDMSRETYSVIESPGRVPLAYVDQNRLINGRNYVMRITQGGKQHYINQQFTKEEVCEMFGVDPALVPDAAPEYTCKFCGAPSHVEPSDQERPVDYCHPSDHE